MKRQERYKILNYAKDQYSKTFDVDYQFKRFSRKKLYSLLKQHCNSCMCEWDYCCYGLYRNCWQELYEKGNWGMTQKLVDAKMAGAIDKYAKYYRKDSRILYCDLGSSIDIILVMRDICKSDFLITFMDEKE